MHSLRHKEPILCLLKLRLDYLKKSVGKCEEEFLSSKLKYNYALDWLNHIKTIVKDMKKLNQEFC